MRSRLPTGHFEPRAAIAGAKLMMFLIDIPYYRNIPARSSPIYAPGRRCFLRRPDRGPGRFSLVHAETKLPGWKTADVLRRPSRSATASAVSAVSGGPLLGRAVRPPVAVTFTNPWRTTGRRTAEHPASSDTTLRSLRRIRYLWNFVLEDPQTARGWSDYWGVLVALLHGALPCGVLSRARTGKSLGRTVRYFPVDIGRVVPARYDVSMEAALCRPAAGAGPSLTRGPHPVQRPSLCRLVFLGLLRFGPASTLRGSDPCPSLSTHTVLSRRGLDRLLDRAGARWFSQSAPQLRHFRLNYLKLLLIPDECSFQCCPV